MIDFRLGQVVATPGALEVLNKAGVTPFEYLRRHSIGNWGDLGLEDKQANDEAIKNRGRIFSAYNLPGGEKIWIITEADRSVTTFLLPSEY